MSDFKFEDKGVGGLNGGFSVKKKQSTMTKLVLKTGIIKDEKYVPFVLFGCAVLFFLLSVYFFMYGF